MGKNDDLDALAEAREQRRNRSRRWRAEMRYELIEKAFALHPERETNRNRAVHEVGQSMSPKVSDRTVETALAEMKKRREREEAHGRTVTAEPATSMKAQNCTFKTLAGWLTATKKASLQ